MHIEELEYFLTLVRTRHFQKASIKSNISPSAFSRAIQRLENSLGEKLFERSSKEVSLSPAGLIFKSYAEDILKSFKEAKEALLLQKGLVSGELSIYCSVTAAYGILPELLDAFRRAYPEVNIRLVTGDAESALEKLQERDMDIVVAALPEDIPEGIGYMHVAQTPLVWIISRNNKAFLDLKLDWEKMPLILPKQGISRQRFDSWHRKMKIRPNIYAQVKGNEAIIAMVHLDCGVGLVPAMVLEKSPVKANIELLKVSPPLKPYIIAVCVNKKRLDSVVVQSFWDVAKAYTKKNLN